ncbi:MAG: hypothetical protein U0U70_16560 [Chitinophagaceae bacterium]
MRPALYYLFMFLLFFSAGCNNGADRKTDNLGKNQPGGDTASAATAPVPEIKYETYCNSRYGYCIDYPATLLYPQGEAPSGDGQEFKSKNADVQLLVYRDLRDNFTMDEPYTIQTAYEEDARGSDPEHPKKVIVYKKLGKDFFAVSGYNNGRIFYQRTILREEGLVTSYIEYPEADSAVYNKVSERIFSSLK